MRLLILVFLLLSFSVFGQNLTITKQNHTYNCAEGLFSVDFAADYDFDESNEFFFKFTDANKNQLLIPAFVYDNQLVRFLPDPAELPYGEYFVSVISTSPSVESNIADQTLNIIDKNVSLGVKIINNTYEVLKGDNIVLEIQVGKPNYPVHIQLNGFDEIDAPLNTPAFKHEIIADRTAVYKILNIGVGGCSVTFLDDEGEVHVKVQEKDKIEWQATLGKSVCEVTTDIISNAYKVYGSFTKDTQYQVQLIDYATSTVFNVNSSMFYNLGDRINLPIHDLTGLPSSEKYYFKIISDFPSAESDLLGPFTISQLSGFNFSNTEKSLFLASGETFELLVDITGEAPWFFWVDGVEYFAESSPYSIKQVFDGKSSTQEFKISNGYALQGGCANFVNLAESNSVTVTLK